MEKGQVDRSSQKPLTLGFDGLGTGLMTVLQSLPAGIESIYRQHLWGIKRNASTYILWPPKHPAQESEENECQQ
jgi:hypothetical protein